MTRRTQLEYLEDIYRAAIKAKDFTTGMDQSEFEADEKTVFAVVRALEIVGEASKGISAALRKRCPGIPWRSMTGLRDVLIHHYMGVDLDVIWKTVAKDLPDLLPQIERLIEEVRNEAKDP